MRFPECELKTCGTTESSVENYIIYLNRRKNCANPPSIGIKEHNGLLEINYYNAVDIVLQKDEIIGTSEELIEIQLCLAKSNYKFKYWITPKER